MERRALLQVLRDGATHQRRRQAPALLLPAHAAPSSSSSSSSSPRRHLHSSAAPRSGNNSNAEGYPNSSAGGARNIPDLAALASGQSEAPGPRVREKPSLSTYYTTRPTYVATLLELAELARQSKRALEQACILKPSMSPPTAADVAAVLSSSASSSSAAAAAAAAALANSGSSGPTWLAPEHMAPHLGIATLKTSQYRRAVAALSLLARYRPLLRVHLTHLDPTLVTRVEQALDTFARRTGTQALSRDGIVTSPTEALRLARLAELRKQRGAGGEEASNEEHELDVFTKKSQLDAHGRAYAFGRRKEASARVWIIPAAPSGSAGDGEATIGRVLINNVPLGQAVSRTDHREQITWPLRLAGKLGLFNVFALVRGGGVSGQAGAVAHALAKALLVAAQNGLVAGGPEEVERIRSVLRKGEQGRAALVCFSSVQGSGLTPRSCSHNRRRPAARPAHGREKEDGPSQGAQGLYLGQAMRRRFRPPCSSDALLPNDDFTRRFSVREDVRGCTVQM